MAKKPDKRNKAHGGKGRETRPKRRKTSLTPRQSRFAKAFATARTITEAAIEAGYGKKYAGQAGHQALKSILRKGPEAMEEAGLTLTTVIERNLKPLLEWTETKFAQHEGEFTDYVTVPDGAIRLAAADKAFRLLGAYPSEDPILNAKVSVDVIISDMPRPRYDVEPIDVMPTVRPPRKELEDPKPVEPEVEPQSGNGTNGAKPPKRDPRPDR
jgi:Terminase small subunit